MTDDSHIHRIEPDVNLDGMFWQLSCLSRKIRDEHFEVLTRKSFGDAVSQLHHVAVIE